MLRGEDVPPEVEPRAYYNMPAWRKIATIFAGPAVNIVLAIVIFAVIFWIGVPTVQPRPTEVRAVQPGQAAAAAGVQPGDRFVGDRRRAAPTGTSRWCGACCQARDPGDEVVLTLERDGRTIERTATLQTIETPRGRTGPGSGSSFDDVPGPTLEYGFAGGLQEGLDFTWFVIEENGKVLGDVFTSEEARDALGGPVGLGAVFNEVAEDGLITILRFIGVDQPGARRSSTCSRSRRSTAATSCSR